MTAMLDDTFVLLRTALRAKGVPFELTEGPGLVPDVVGATRIELCRDEAADLVVPSKTDNNRNPRMVAVRAVAWLVRIYAHSTLEGARLSDHQRLADRIVDFVHASLVDICREEKTAWRVTKAGFAPATKTPERWAGRVYEYAVQIDRGVYAFPSWTSAAAAEAELEASSGVTTLTTTGPNAVTDLPSATTRVS